MKPSIFLASTALLATAFLSTAFLSTADEKKPEAEPASEWKSLTEGNSMEGWTGAVAGYSIDEDGVISCAAKGGGNIYTAAEYGNFEFDFEFKLTPGANNGIGIRTPNTGDPAYVGMEIQVLDDSSEKYAKLHDYQYHGSIYGVVAAKRGHQKPVGEWNHERIICDGTKITVILNDVEIVSADIEGIETLDGKAHPGLTREKGHIAFCGHGADVQFRNVRIKELSK